MIRARSPGPPALLLVGAVRGLAAEGPALAEALSAFDPEAVGLAHSSEELAALVEYFGDVDAEPIVPLSPTELNELRGLVRFGEVAVPDPAVVEAMRWARENGRPCAALDPSDESTAALFTDHIGYVELVRRTVRQNRIGRSPPSAATADEFAVAWDRAIAHGRGSRRYAEARNRHLVDEARRLGQGRRSVAVLVDRERFEPVRALLGAEPLAR